MPENVLKKTTVPHQWKSCFYSALIVGLIAHLYKITGWIPNWDSLVFRYDPQNMIGLGRWFLPVACGFSSFYDLPFLNGIFAILFTAMGAVCIVKIFGVKKDVTAGLIGAVTVSFPVVTSIMMYSYVADGYSIGFFLACLSVLMLTKEKPSFLISVILMSLATGIYQSYISVSAVLLLLYLIDEIIFKKKDIKSTLKKFLKFAFAGFLGLTIYYGILKLILIISGDTLLSYQGFDSAMDMANVDVLASLYVLLNSMKKFFFDFSSNISAFSIINILITIVTFVTYFAFVIKNKIFKQWDKLILLLIMLILIPVGANIIVFIDPYVAFHSLMKMSYFVLYIAFIILYERIAFLSKNFIREKVWTVFIIGCLITANQIVIANVSYHIAQIAYEKSYGTLIRIVDRIEQTENSENCNEILIIGALPESESYSVNLPPDITGITENYILRKDDESVKQSVMCYSINDYCGKEYTFLSGNKKKEYLKKEEIQAMKLWPHKDSVRVVDNVIVLKLGTESE